MFTVVFIQYFTALSHTRKTKNDSVKIKLLILAVVIKQNSTMLTAVFVYTLAVKIAI